MSINGEVLGDCLGHLRRLINLTRYTSSFTIQIKNNYLVMSTGSTVKLTRPLSPMSHGYALSPDIFLMHYYIWFLLQSYICPFIHLLHLFVCLFVVFACFFYLSICFPVAFVFNWLFLLVKGHCTMAQAMKLRKLRFAKSAQK